MKWTELLTTHTGFRAGMSILCWMVLLIHVAEGQQTGMNERKKMPEDLICYQNYTSYDNFCYCSWRAGEESQNPTYTLHYCLHRDETECSYFNTGNLTYISLSNEVVHMRENISIEVIAEEKGHNYTSKQITLILDKAVKLDPPDHWKITITRRGSEITVSWIRPDIFSATLNTKKELRYKEHLVYLDPLPCKTSNSATCSDDDIPTCRESCTFSLDGHRGHYVQIRQTYEEGVWSEWSDPIFVPAEIGPVQIENITTGKLNFAGIRTVSLCWKPSPEGGNMHYQVNVTFLPCSGVTTSHSINHYCFHANISGAAYNVTITASNEAQTASPWSTVIKEDWAAIPFKNVTLSGKNLTMKWKGKKADKTSYCIVWKTSDMKVENSSKVLENLNNNNATIHTDHFLPMKCYKIYIYKMSKNFNTVGTTYYLKPALSIGPGNFTVENVTANSILLKWDAFDLDECQKILQNWIINKKDHETNDSKEIYENSSVTRYLVERSSPGYNYTFEVKGITIFGEQTGTSVKSVYSPWTAENTSKSLLGKIVGIIAALLFLAFILLLSWRQIKQYTCQDLPNPSNSTAATFPPSDNKHNVSRPHLVDTSSEENTTEPLIIETITKIKVIERAVEETETLDMASTKSIFENDLIPTEVDTEVEVDLQFEYRKQVAPMTPVNEKDMGTHFFEKMKEDLPYHLECPKENNALLDVNSENLSISES
ncbi:leukemia inhibitory factor receptor-like isoform X2 [Hyla sarda]|uniref:leukemia inhibitory factor receptor-like isoform X2 n=1 Tax=Hyla sarda TaxID=327740 RepID=UPI0024C46362|nr:leukemia inhibitory factor receptor-like isoform X2 [Hyla sarda]